MVLFFNSFFGDVCQPDDTSRTAVSFHGQWNCADTEVLGLFVSHVGLVVRITISVNETTAWASHCEVSFQSGSSQVHWINLRALVWIPTCDNVSSLQLFLVIDFLEHSCGSKNVRQFSLLNAVGIDQVTNFVCGLLWLTGSSTSQDANVIMNEINFIGYSVNSVNATGGGSWIKKRWYLNRRREWHRLGTWQPWWWFPFFLWGRKSLWIIVLGWWEFRTWIL